jgi:hypothetical protein
MNISVKRSSKGEDAEFKGFKLESGNKDLESALEVFNERVKKRFSFEDDQDGGIRVLGKLLEGSENERYKIEFVSNDCVVISASSRLGYFHAVSTLERMLYEKNGVLHLELTNVEDWPDMDDRGLIADLGGQGYLLGPARWNKEEWMNFIDWMSRNKLNVILFEIIFTGGLMGNVKVSATEWAGLPIALEGFEDVTLKNRPFKKWDAEKQEIVTIDYTAPNVEVDFIQELIDYAKLRGMKVLFFIPYNYFASQIRYIRNIPDSCLSDKRANAFFDDFVSKLLTRYENYDGVTLHLPEGLRLCDCAECSSRVTESGKLMPRIHDGINLVKKLKPDAEIHILIDSLTWLDNQLDELQAVRDEVGEDIILDWTPPNDFSKGWLDVWGEKTWKYLYYTKFAWHNKILFFPEFVKDQIARFKNEGYKSAYSQAWYFDGYEVNLASLASCAWGGEFDEKAVKELVRENYGEKGAEEIYNALSHLDKAESELFQEFITGEKRDVLDPAGEYNGVSDEALLEIEERSGKALAFVEKAQALRNDDKPYSITNLIKSSAIRKKFSAEAVRLSIAAEEKITQGDIGNAEQDFNNAMAAMEKAVDGVKMLDYDYPMGSNEVRLKKRVEEVGEKIKKSLNK